MRNRVVHLRAAVVAPSHQSQHLAGARIERDQRHLRVGVRLAQLFVVRVNRVYLRVHHVDRRVHGFCGQALQFRIERGVDAQPFAVEIAIAQPLRQLIVHQVDKVGRFAFIHAARDQVQRLSLRGFGLILADGAGFHHRIQHQVAPLNSPLRMVEGIEAAGTLDEPGEQGALGQVELGHILAKVILRCLAEAIDGKTANLAEGDLVGIHGEDLLLVKPMLEDDADHGLAHLARISALGREEEAARQLLREGRCALGVVMKVKDVVAHCAQDAQIIDAAVLKKSPVLDGDDGMRQVGRNFVVGEHAALDAVGVLAESGNQQRLKLIARKRLPVLVGDVVDHATADVDGSAIGRVIRLRAGPYGDLLRALAERAQQRWLRGAVAAVAGLA